MNLMEIGDLMSVEDYLENVEAGGFIDYDGYGYPVTDGEYNSDIRIFPSEYDKNIPEHATHILWFNR